MTREGYLLGQVAQLGAELVVLALEVSDSFLF